jgi:hypothetical protein
MAGGALIVRFTLGKISGQTGGPAKPLDASEVDSFLAIHADGRVTIYASKVDVGTGLATAFRQTAAEELGIPVERFTVIEGDTALTPDHGGTGGSSGIPRGAADIRRVAATAHQALLDLGAKQLNLPASELTIAGGDVTHSSGRRATVASLIGDKRLGLKVNPNAPLKNPSAYTVVGKPILRADVPGKCTAKHPYLLHAQTQPTACVLVCELYNYPYWRQRRAWAIETALLDKHIALQPGETAPERMAAAFDHLAASPTLPLLHRYETRQHLMYQRALRTFILLRTVKLPNDPSPISEHPPDVTKPATPPVDQPTDSESLSGAANPGFSRLSAGYRPPQATSPTAAHAPAKPPAAHPGTPPHVKESGGAA